VSYSPRRAGDEKCSCSGAALIIVLACLNATHPCYAAPSPPTAEGDAAAIAACLSEPATNGLDPRTCGDRVMRICLDGGGSNSPPPDRLRCEQRRSDAWTLLARQAYREIEAKLGDANRRLLRTSQVQFELELRDLCIVARAAMGGDPDLATASCSGDLLASRALVLRKLANGGAGAY
jgi:hypothetical protein